MQLEPGNRQGQELEKAIKRAMENGNDGILLLVY